MQFLFLASLVLGCSSTERSADADFLDRSMMERRSVILRHSLEEQIDLYLDAMTKKEPPDLALADVVASNGAPIVPFIAKRLETDGREIATTYLIDVLVRMQELGHYDVASDAATMQSVGRQVASMKAGQWKQLSEEMTARIRRGPSTTDETARKITSELTVGMTRMEVEDKLSHLGVAHTYVPRQYLETIHEGTFEGQALSGRFDVVTPFEAKGGRKSEAAIHIELDKQQRVVNVRVEGF